MAPTRRPPWKKTNPRKRRGKAFKNKASKSKASKSLSQSQKATARRRARKAGRPYPNLVDNMAVAKGRKRAKKRK